MGLDRSLQTLLVGVAGDHREISRPKAAPSPRLRVRVTVGSAAVPLKSSVSDSAMTYNRELGFLWGSTIGKVVYREANELLCNWSSLDSILGPGCARVLGTLLGLCTVMKQRSLQPMKHAHD